MKGSKIKTNIVELGWNMLEWLEKSQFYIIKLLVEAETYIYWIFNKESKKRRNNKENRWKLLFSIEWSIHFDQQQSKKKLYQIIICQWNYLACFAYSNEYNAINNVWLCSEISRLMGLNSIRLLESQTIKRKYRVWYALLLCRCHSWLGPTWIKI